MKGATSTATFPCSRDAVVIAQNLCKSHGKVRAVDNLSFTLRAGEIVALLGPNGAGKTTTVRLLLGLTTPNAGTVKVFGRRAGKFDARCRVGAMLQVSLGGIHPELTIGEQIELFRCYYPNPMPIEEVIETASLRGLENRRFGKLSGGQRQRALFALSLCSNPDLLILDEPTVGLDVEARRALWTRVREMSMGGKTVLLTTHNLEEADRLADRILVLERGRLIAEGTPAELKTIDKTRQVRCRTSLSVDQLREISTVTEISQDGPITILSTSDSDSVVRCIVALDPEVSDLQAGVVALEDAFIALTKMREE